MKGFLAGAVGSMLALFGTGAAGAEYETAEIYQNLRGRVFSVEPAELGLKPTAGNRVWGVLMETGYSEAVATLVVLAEGTVSLYFSNGGGMIGLGEHKKPRAVAKALLDSAPDYVRHCTSTSAYPLPTKGSTRFYLLTFDGVFTTEAPEDDFGYNRHALSPLFHRAHELIAAARAAEEAARTKQ
jgi:hypothetical protein